MNKRQTNIEVKKITETAFFGTYAGTGLSPIRRM